MAVIYEILCIVSFSYLIQVVSLSQLNVPRVLLPYNLGVPTKYVLEVTSGECYKWNSSQPDVVQVTLLEPVEDPHTGGLCSKTALISSVSASHARSSSIVIAENLELRETLRCDVIVDGIHSIEIHTTSKELFLEDAPGAMEVLAKNDHEGTFSSIDGVPFEWSLISDTPHGLPVDGLRVLKFLKFAETAYKPPPAIAFWEDQGLQGYKVLVEGMHTGTAQIRARIRHPSYEHVTAADILLTIVANLVLIPSYDVYMMLHTTVHYRVMLIKRQIPHEVPMPSEQYFLEVESPDLASLDTKTTHLTALKQGHTRIALKDRKTPLLETTRMPSAGIFIVCPSYLSFSVQPGDNWALQEFSTYIVTVKLHDEQHHAIIPAENVRIAVSFPSTFFNVNYSSPNGTYHVVHTLIPGPCKIKAELLGVKKADKTTLKFEPTVKGTQDVAIYQAVSLQPPLIFLPWNPVTKLPHTAYLQASGGTGFYKWVSDNSSAITIIPKSGQHNSRVAITITKEGNFTVTVIDVHNSYFFSKGMIIVRPIADLEILPSVVEAEIGNAIVIPVALFGFEDLENTRRRMFDACSDIPLTVHLVEKDRVIHVEESEYPAIGNACRTLHFVCKTPGYTGFYVKYETGDVVLKSTGILSCFKPLKAVHPVRVAVLPPGSSVDVAFEGGPRAWPMLLEGHYTNLTAENTALVNFVTVLDPFRLNKDLHIFHILCRDIGESNLNLVVGNDASPTNLSPARSTVFIKIVCGFPDIVILKLTSKDKQSQCISDENVIKVPVFRSNDLSVEILAKDKLGRRFANMTSLDIVWESSDNTLATPASYQGVKVDVNNAATFRKVIRHYQNFHLQGKKGQLQILAKITGCRADILSQGKIKKSFAMRQPLTGTLELELVEKPEVEPRKVSVFNHPTNKVEL